MLDVVVEGRCSLYALLQVPEGSDERRVAGLACIIPAIHGSIYRERHVVVLSQANRSNHGACRRAWHPLVDVSTKLGDLESIDEYASCADDR